MHAALSRGDARPPRAAGDFDAAFDAFWRDPKLLEQLMYLLLPKISGRGDKAEQAAREPARRSARAAARRGRRRTRPTSRDEELEFDTSFTFSDRERLQQADFETMTAAEFELAKKLAEQLPLPVAPVRRRRHEASARAAARPARDDAAHGAPAAHADAGVHAGRATSCRRSSCCSTSPARWSATRGCCCTTCMA